MFTKSSSFRLNELNIREDFKKINSKKNDIVQKGGEVSEKNQILNV